ncbi:ABC transporter substrate-binding protein [Castellaniella sp. S9]|uniref:ABC transporter substrate-binding protein n=1 Tax=Castellaniella sp. S9 TaxID=2993652 RepID=UPI0022B5664A|nr:ABC transporter substrate-binding protein [Castellaniella sp. S9]
MKKFSLSVVMVACVGAQLFSQPVFAAEPVKIGVLVDMSGPYSAFGGPGVALATEMAVKDFGGTVLDRPIEVLTADYQNKIDITSTRAREWYDRDKVDMIIESTDSSSALLLQKLAAEKEKVVIFAGSGTSRLTNEDCSPYGIHYVFDTYSLANSTAKALTQAGNKSWYFITVDYAFGNSLQADATKAIEELGGKVLGSSKHPAASADFGAFLMQAQGSGANVVALANAGKDLQNTLRQASEFGISTQQIIAPFYIFETDIKGVGLDLVQGAQYTTGFYWDRNDQTREWSNRFYEKHKAMPTMIQAGAYSAVMHYLQAIKAAGTADAAAVIDKMKELPINDMFAQGGYIREDGRMVHDMYLMKIKAPAESEGEWDMATVQTVVKGDDAYRSLSESTCSLVKKG